MKKIQTKRNSVVLHQKDWQEFCPEKNKYQIIISNDLFPNVDQRLDEFLEKYIPFAKEIRMSLTYYDVRKTYQVKRVDGDEVFFIRPWNGRQLSEVLRNFQDRIKNPDLDALFQENRSIFANGRQVCLLKIRGDG